MSTSGGAESQVRETIQAGNDFRSTGLYKAVDYDGDFSAAGGATLAGIAVSQPNSGQHLAVIAAGVTKAYAGGAIAVGAYVQVAASGYLVTTASASVGAVGRALIAAASGALFRVRMF